MGVDFTGYSNLICMPIPDKFKAKKIKQQMPDINSIIPAEYRTLCMMMYGIGNNNGNLSIRDIIEKTREAEEWEDEMYANDKDDELAFIDWDNDCYYIKSKESKHLSCYRSYSGYADFIKYCNNCLKRRLRYVIPSTNSSPENGFATNISKLKMLYEDLQEIKEQFTDNEEHEWFYIDFCKMIELAIQCGGVSIG